MTELRHIKSRLRHSTVKSNLTFIGDRINAIINQFDRDFYGCERKLSLILCGILSLNSETKDRVDRLVCHLCRCSWKAMTDWASSIRNFETRSLSLLSCVYVEKEKAVYTMRRLELHTLVYLFLCSQKFTFNIISFAWVRGRFCIFINHKKNVGKDRYMSLYIIFYL